MAPPFLVCDADALMQFLLVGEIRPLRVLISRYRVQPILVPEVEQEILSHRRLGRRVTPALNKALNNGTLKVLSKSLLEAHFGATAGALAADAAIQQVQAQGAAYETYADFGESYTHATAMVLNVPAMSNDISALSALVNAGMRVPSTVLRPFDLVALCYQVQEMSANECDGFRARLAREREHIPRAFAGQSFVDGLRSYTPRIVDSSCARVGRTANVGAPLEYSNIIEL